MKNKRLAIFLTICVFLAVIVVLTRTIFTLKTVDVQFMSTTQNITNTNSQIVESGKFKYGESVFISNKKAYIQNIEKSNPYIKVVNIETIFPSKYVIHAIERNECFVVKLKNNKYAVTDEELKVLKILDDYQNNASNGIEILDSTLGEQSVQAGDFFSTTNNYFKVMFDCFREWQKTNKSYSEVKARIKSVCVNYEAPDRLLVNMRSGVQIIVENSLAQLSDKLNLAFSFYDTTTNKAGEPVDYTKSGIILITESKNKIFGLYKPL